MGNCNVRGATVSVIGAPQSVNNDVNTTNSIRLVTQSCKIIEIAGPRRVGEIIGNFPGHGIFHKGDFMWPLPKDEQLIGGHELYYLLPLNLLPNLKLSSSATLGYYLSASSDHQSFKSLEVLPSLGDGVWRVKLAIGANQLAEILSEQATIEALIQRMRTYACTQGKAQKQVKMIKRLPHQNC